MQLKRRKAALPPGPWSFASLKSSVSSLGLRALRYLTAHPRSNRVRTPRSSSPTSSPPGKSEKKSEKTTAAMAEQDGGTSMAIEGLQESEDTEMNGGDYVLDCYPYTFSPLLLFAQANYFDKGYSNYCSVAQFFAPALADVNMLENVLYDRKNMLYEELLDFVTKNKMLVPCCIDAHFTAFQVIGDKMLIYYDPLQSSLSYVTGDSYLKLVGFLLLKCNLGDGQHMQDNKAYYTGPDSNPTRRVLYKLWTQINTMEMSNLGLRTTQIFFDLDQYLLINGVRDHRTMSCQLTGNTCYFQTYLFAVLCKVGEPALARSGTEIQLQNVEKLLNATVQISRFLLEFFVKDKVMRPLTNSNFVLDFYRYKEAPYYHAVTKYLQHLQLPVPDYTQQYKKTLEYLEQTKTLHTYSKFTLSGAMSSTVNTKSLQPVFGTDDAVYKLAQSNYYKYRACNLMFGFNSGIMSGLKCFCEFNALRKNQLLAFYEQLHSIITNCEAVATTNKYRDYYFMPQFEVGQKELVDVHHYTYLIDMRSMKKGSERSEEALIDRVNQILAEHIFFSTQKRSDYEKFLSKEEFKSNKKYYSFFTENFMAVPFFTELMGLGFAEINPKEKDINALTQTSFYSTELMRGQQYRMEHEFEKECINQMARSTQRGYLARFDSGQSISQKYRVSIKIGHGFTYSKYNTLMHFLNVMDCYWQNPDLNNIQLFGKDIRALLAISCQKIFFEKGHSSGYYYYGVLEQGSQRGEMDLAVASSVGHVIPGVSRDIQDANRLVLTDRVYEYHYLRNILAKMFEGKAGTRVTSDNAILNLSLLSLMLDFGLYEEHASLLNLPLLKRLQRLNDKRQLQVEVANLIHEFDRKNSADSVTRIKLEGLIFEASYKFLVNKNFPVQSRQNELIQQLNADPAYQQHLLLCKVNMSLCQINKSVEVDYYKVRCNGEYRTIIPRTFSKSTDDYLQEVTKRYTFVERDDVILYGELALFDLRSLQPEVNLFKVRFDSATEVQSMVKYIEIKNAFQAMDSEQQYLVFIADNALLIEVSNSGAVTIRISKNAIEAATIYFNEAISFVPCFKYADSEDVILFASPNIKYLVDQGGQFCTDYYGMKHELMGCINSEEIIVDLNDEHVFKQFKLSELLTESKTVVFSPNYLLQVPSKQELINLLDFAIHVRNVSFFILVLFYLRRSSIALQYINKERGDGRDETTKITGPWYHAIRYVLNMSSNQHYESIFERQFFDLNEHANMPLSDFIEVLCSNFTKYQRRTDDGQYQIVPTEKQKAFLQRIICAEECFHFSEVGSGKTKVILPLLCQMFLSNNVEAHSRLARGGKSKSTLVVLVPEHLVTDARTQVYRYCLNLNFREEYRVYDDIFALLHENVQMGSSNSLNPMKPMKPMKQIFITSFNQFKKALTYDKICKKVMPHRESMLIVADEIDDFLDRDKLVFNICSNKANNFDKSTLELYFEVAQTAYHAQPCADALLDASTNPDYWRQLHDKFCAIHTEIQDASRSVNKAFGIFNEQTLRHCSTNIAYDVEGYKSLIARPYESVNRAMPGSYYSDVERTVYLTFVILTEDIAKYNELFQQERKFISFEYWSAHLDQLDYDDLVYGQERLSELVAKFPETKQGLVRFLYEIILRRMEIRDKSRSVNSIDIVFNFDCIGFTGTPFIDNYPTFSYLRGHRQDEIPSLIDRSFYVYTSDALPPAQFEERFARFQGQNKNVVVEFVPSGFVKKCAQNELSILQTIFEREDGATADKRQERAKRGERREEGATADKRQHRQQRATVSLTPLSADQAVEMCRKDEDRQESSFNVIVDLCGVFKRSTIHDVRDLVKRHFGPDRFHYVYHIDQVDSSDRILSVSSDNDVQFDEEFYKFLCKTYGAGLRDKVFFFVDNRNVIGKDIPFQLVFQRRFGLPLFTKSVVLAHDVDDFSKIWQAMGRSRTMNDTPFSIYINGISEGSVSGEQDMKTHKLTRQLYVKNCDQKMAGNLSSIYQTLVSLFNLSNESFYFCDRIVNTFLEKMTGSIGGKVRHHADELMGSILGDSGPSLILRHILTDKFKRSSVSAVSTQQLTPKLVEDLLLQIVEQKYEQRSPSGDIYDDYIRLLSGEQESLMEISYTKQQQKQKQKQHNKNQDSDTMDIFNKKNQLDITIQTDNYYQYALTPQGNVPKIALSLPIPIPILSLSYTPESGSRRSININVYPTLQFLYSHHIQAEYITQEVREALRQVEQPNFDLAAFCKSFLAVTTEHKRPVAHGADLGNSCGSDSVGGGARGHAGRNIDDPVQHLEIKITKNDVRQSPQYTLAAIEEGVYVIGMKDQFNMYDLPGHPLCDNVQYIADEVGFILYNRENGMMDRPSIDSFGPYFIQQYILLEVLSKQEVAQNVLDYYVNHKQKLQESLAGYNETQGKGFICWRFLMNNKLSWGGEKSIKGAVGKKDDMDLTHLD